MDENKDIDVMRQIIEKKKQKSASQGSVKRGPQDRYSTRKPGKKNQKSGDSIPRETGELGDEA